MLKLLRIREGSFVPMDEFTFADAYRLETGTTRSFYESFLRGLVHKHNNLMTSIQGFSSLVLLEGGLSDEVRENVEQILHSVRQATAMNSAVLAAGIGRKLDLAPTDFAAFAAYWRSKASDLCEESGVPLEMRMAEGLPRVMADRDKLTELFTHLLTNAAEAAARVPEGSVSVELAVAAEEPGRVDLTIRNRSEAMDERAVREAFLPFDRAAPGEHFGIGLTIAAVLAGDMGMRLGLKHAEGVTTARLSMAAV